MPNFKPWQWITLIALLLAVNVVVIIGLVLAVMTFVWTEPAGLVAESGVPAPTLRPTFTPTFTPEVWPTATSTRTPTRMPPPTPTWTPLPTRTPTITPTPWPTDTPTPYRPPTDTPTLTPTRTPVPTRTPLPTFTSTPVPMLTPTSTPTSLPTSTWTPLPTATATPSPSPTRSPVPLPTATVAPAIAIRPMSATPSPSATPTPWPSPTDTATLTPSPSPSATATNTPPPPPSPSATATNTPTSSPSPSATPTLSPSPTPSAARRATFTPAAVALLPISEGRPLEAVSLAEDSISLAWQPVAGATTYRVYSDMGTGYGVYILKAETDRPALTDVNLRPGLRYNYRVGAVSRAGETMVAHAATLTPGSLSVASAAKPSSGEASGGASGQSALASSKPKPAPAPLRVTPAPTPLPPDTIILGMLSATDYADEVDGTLTIVGEVRNDSALDVGETAVTATFYGADGQIIGEVGGPTLLQTLAPGVRSPFMITLPRPAGVANYSLRATGRPVTPATTDGQLVVVNTRRFEDTAGFYHIAGVIQNRGAQRVEQVRVIVTLYDRGGRVINVGFAYPQPSVLSPGDRADFDVTFTYYPKVFSHAAVAVRD